MIAYHEMPPSSESYRYGFIASSHPFSNWFLGRTKINNFLSLSSSSAPNWRASRSTEMLLILVLKLILLLYEGHKSVLLMRTWLGSMCALISWLLVCYRKLITFSSVLNGDTESKLWAFKSSSNSCWPNVQLSLFVISDVSMFLLKSHKVRIKRLTDCFPQPKLFCQLLDVARPLWRATGQQNK